MGHHVKGEDRLIEQLARSMDRVNRAAKGEHARLQSGLPSPEHEQYAARQSTTAAAGAAPARPSSRLQALAAPPPVPAGHSRLAPHQLQLAQSSAPPTAGSISQRLLASESHQKRLLKVQMTPTQLEAHKKLMAQPHSRAGAQDEQLRTLVRHQLEILQHQQEEMQHTGHMVAKDHPTRLSTAHSDVWEHGSVHSQSAGHAARSEAMVASHPQGPWQHHSQLGHVRPGAARTLDSNRHTAQQVVSKDSAGQQVSGKPKEAAEKRQPLNIAIRPSSTVRAPADQTLTGQYRAMHDQKSLQQPGGVPPTEAALKCLPVQDRPSNYKPVPSELASHAGWWRGPGSVATKLSYPCTAVTDRGSATPSEMVMWESKMSELERSLRDERLRRQRFEQELKELQTLAASRAALTTGRATAGVR